MSSSMAEDDSTMPPPSGTLSLKVTTAFFSFIRSLGTLVMSLERAKYTSQDLDAFRSAAKDVLEPYDYAFLKSLDIDALRASDIEELRESVEENALFDVTEGDRLLHGLQSHYNECLTDGKMPRELVEGLNKTYFQYWTLVLRKRSREIAAQVAQREQAKPAVEKR